MERTDAAAVFKMWWKRLSQVGVLTGMVWGIVLAQIIYGFAPHRAYAITIGIVWAMMMRQLFELRRDYREMKAMERELAKVKDASEQAFMGLMRATIREQHPDLGDADLECLMIEVQEQLHRSIEG